MTRVVSYNISGGSDLGRLSDVLTQLRPDVVCLQEAPSRRRVGRLARSAGLVLAMRAGRTRAGTAVLVGEDVRVRSTDAVPLATPPGVPVRTAVHAIVGVGSLPLSVVSAQLGLRTELRRHSLQELTTFLGTVGAHSVVGCDLNESALRGAGSMLVDRYQDAFAVAGSGPGETYPSGEPSSRQDVVLVAPELVVGRCHVPRSEAIAAASHHLPVVVDIAGERSDDVEDSAGSAA